MKYKSLFEIKKMINILAGFSNEQIKLIQRIAEVSYECGCINEQLNEGGKGI